MHSIFALISLLISFNLLAKIEPPNYKFSLDSLEIFGPGKDIGEIEKKHGKGKLVKDSGDLKAYEFSIKHIRYQFPVFVQIYKGKSLDFFARLPSYFLHDVFHQSIINRHGKQNKYFNQDGTAIYKWIKKDNSEIQYSGSCTITCFPVYYSFYTKNIPEDLGTFEPYIKQLNTSKFSY